MIASLYGRRRRGAPDDRSLGCVLRPSGLATVRGARGAYGSNLYTGSRHQERTDLRADAALHYRPVSSGAGQTLPGGQLIPLGILSERHVGRLPGVAVLSRAADPCERDALRPTPRPDV